MSLLAVTVIGHDRPGIIADTTSALAELGGNLEDSTMTILRGHFAMVLLVSTTAPLDVVETELAVLTGDGTLEVSVREVRDEPDDGDDADATAGTTAYLLSVHGADRPGIVSAVTGVLASAGGNITDLSTRLTGDLYVLAAEVDLPASVDLETLRQRLAGVAAGLQVEASLTVLDSDVM
jgi:glycine cleavage system transcriptional repressor